MSTPTASNYARLAELAELCAVVSAAQICEAFVHYSGHVDNVRVYVNHVGCSCAEGNQPEFSQDAYMDNDELAGIGGTVRMDELLANLRAFLAETYGFSLVRAA